MMMIMMMITGIYYSFCTVLSFLLYSAVLVLLRCSLPALLLLLMTRIIIRFFTVLPFLFSSLLYSGALVLRLRCFSVLFLCTEVAVVFVFRWCSPK
jgi:hypothetical protein